MRWTHDDIKEGFAFDVERYVLDDNSSGYNLVIGILTRSGRGYGGNEMTHRGRATRGRKVGMVVGGKRTIFWDGYGVVEPLLRNKSERMDKKGALGIRTVGRPPRAGFILSGEGVILRGL